MNRLYDVFLQRNPTFKGQVSVIGHSLGKSNKISYQKNIHSIFNRRFSDSLRYS